jgi:hypothetical protein
VSTVFFFFVTARMLIEIIAFGFTVRLIWGPKKYKENLIQIIWLDIMI